MNWEFLDLICMAVTVIQPQRKLQDVQVQSMPEKHQPMNQTRHLIVIANTAFEMAKIVKGTGKLIQLKKQGKK